MFQFKRFIIYSLLIGLLLSVYSSIYNLLIFNALVALSILILVYYVRPHWSEWWEQHIVAPHPDEPAIAEDVCRLLDLNITAGLAARSSGDKARYRASEWFPHSF